MLFSALTQIESTVKVDTLNDYDGKVAVKTSCFVNICVVFEIPLYIPRNIEH